MIFTRAGVRYQVTAGGVLLRWYEWNELERGVWVTVHGGAVGQ